MPSFRSILLFASATLVAFVAASPSANTIQALPGVLTAAKTQLLALQADVNHASTAGSVVDAPAANVYVDKIASIVSIAQSGARISCTGVLSPSTFQKQCLCSVLSGLLSAVSQLLSGILGSLRASGLKATSNLLTQ
ncbi:hypothetical protein H0H93_009930 [Arthromyces matolae]|nr:hypothetical protein H0H93_009930 [Arthromyces matolae]